MPSTRRALLSSFTGRYYLIALQLVSTVVISHILTPTEIGIFSLAAAGIGLAHVLRDFGIGTYIIQEKELTRDRIRAAQTVAYLTAWPIAAVLFLVAPYAAEFYHQPGVGQVFRWLSINFLLLPIGTVLSAYLSREMRFGTTQGINAFAGTAGFGVTLAAAFLGASYMSMVYGSLAAQALTIASLRLFQPADFPMLPGLREVRRVFRIGIQVASAQIVNEVGMALPELMIGRIQGMELVAFFSRAVGGAEMITRFALDGVQPIVAPAFAKMNREGGDIAAAYRRAHVMTMAVTWPAIALLFLFAKPAVLLLFGHQWLAVVPLLRLILVSRLLYMASVYAESALSGISQVGVATQLTISLKILRIIAVLASVWFGLVPMLCSFIGLSVIRYVIASWLARRYFAAQLTDEWRSMLEAALITASTLIVPVLALLATGRMPGHVGPFEMIILGASGAIGWLAAIVATGNPLAHELRQAISKVRSWTINRRRSTKGVPHDDRRPVPRDVRR